MKHIGHTDKERKLFHVIVVAGIAVLAAGPLTFSLASQKARGGRSQEAVTREEYQTEAVSSYKAEETSEAVSEDAAEGALEAVSEDVSESASDEGSEDVSESASEVVSGISGDAYIAEGLPPLSPDDATGESVTEAAGEAVTESAAEAAGKAVPTGSETFTWNPSWNYASYSAIHESPVTIWYSDAAERREKVICVNAGHGCSAGSSVRTLCHPDGTPKVTGGSTAAGETTATACSVGTTMIDGTPESQVNLALAMILKEQLLAHGYDVLMIRESPDVQLDNIARTVYANNLADCHLALHYDSTASDKGFYFISVPDIASYRAMEPVASHWSEHIRLGQALLQGEISVGTRIFGEGSMPIDLTQTSYSTIPSVDVEVGDTASDYSEATLRRLASGIVAGLDIFFGA